MAGRAWHGYDITLGPPAVGGLPSATLKEGYWLRSKGEGYLTRINDILSNLMEAERRIGAGR